MSSGDEFLPGASEWDDGLDRRRFLELMGASLALAGLTGCPRAPAEPILPFAKSPERDVVSRPLRYATALSYAGVAEGVLVRSDGGRPNLVEGNPDHPSGAGSGTSPQAQAAILSLYDPERSPAVLHEGRPSTWAALLARLDAALRVQAARGGAGLRILSGAVGSPTLARQRDELLARFPEARWHAWEPAGRDAALEGARLAFGRPLDAVPSLEAADVILALDADALACGRDSAGFTSRRRAERGFGAMNRLYALESSCTATGAAADHRLALRPSEVGRFARALDARLRGRESAVPRDWEPWLGALHRDLDARRGASLVVAGDGQPPWLHALVHGMNRRLGNVGRTLRLVEPVAPTAGPPAALAAEIAAGRVEVLLVLGSNPAYAAPADLDVAALLPRVPLSVHLGPHVDETAALCRWHAPEAHELESWSDARSRDGTASIVQPLIAPLHGGRSVHELLSAVAGRPGRPAHELVRETWRGGRSDADFERFWREALHRGWIEGSAFPELAVAPADPELPAEGAAEGLEIAFRPDPAILDGRFANNAWLQELPRPLTSITWDQPAMLGPATAGRLGLETGRVAELRRGGRAIRLPVYVQAGHAEGCVTLALGGGRTRAGRVGNAVGVSAYRLAGAAGAAEMAATSERRAIAATQEHHRLEGADVVRGTTRSGFLADPGFARREEPLASAYPDRPGGSPAWGMAIDLNACTGCNACVVACQAENNVPTVGREQVLAGREMHWLRIDAYHDGTSAHLQPMLCQHCEKAPCEPVCPVGATTHSADGLNEMTYNRCVGTRYCSNNCPYKVRRFNFLEYVAPEPVRALGRNPRVTVRSRGVMEKCTFCVQRIRTTSIDAKREGRALRDGEVETACQVACPNAAIVFGDLSDPGSRASRLRASPLSYGALADLNTRPRVGYLARIRNPEPGLERELGR